MSFSDRDFRNALGLFGTGVAIVTAEVEGTLLGTTVSSFNSVSLAPPLVLFSLARSAMAHGLWTKASAFAVTVLREDQNELSNRFARGGSDKWAGITPARSDTGTPYIADGLVSFFCDTQVIHEGGDHDIVVGRVTSFRCNEGSPLLFFSGRYRRLQTDQPIETPADADLWLHGW
ncbi:MULTISPECIES: flavin reductase family protein [unclassified Beijerinckia]|uniref:flavin reductase family protein n=1 Tax=unclassified Beijerinckia TaxID=2638183 RepID=UPI00089D9EBA|nr:MULTISPECIES: flavin reductase family protein [unclassified Beijerinckia]MDH7794037.1 flavin reductase (DIM6/NTAB) family NADH-FMN oxidoreductase RutF [Beijerinckia sp. GAS462]SEB51931.1 NADH-FMN oxidoreductase RutF, flavin reductase (DIM6/NTAB) family [Beijerinckia sp. 28-YEA-48]